MGSRVGGSRLSPWTERRILAILLCYPNAKCSSCQTAPSCHCVKQSCSLSLSRSSSSLSSLPLFKAPFRSCLIFSSLFVVVLPPSAHFYLFLQICLDLLSSLTLSFLLLSFAFIAFLYFISCFPPLSPHARFHSRPLAGVWHHSLCLLSLKGNWKRTKVIKSTIQSRYAD